jgi:hypothetical protein
MNDSGLDLQPHGRLQQAETLKTWTPGLAAVGLAGMAVTLVLSAILPLD